MANPDDWDCDNHAYCLSKTINRILHHKAQLREVDGAVERKKKRREHSRVESTVDADVWSTDEWIEHLIRGSNKQRFQYCLDSVGNRLYLRAIQVHSGKQKVDPTW